MLKRTGGDHGTYAAMPGADPTWTMELEAALVRELAANFAWENDARFARKLMAPVVVLSDSPARLGRWIHATRTLELSRKLVLERPWAEVVSVLQHEMAHQFVDEVLRVHDETAHGETFQRVCAERGIDGKAAGAPVPVTDVAGGIGVGEADRVLDRIRKLLALAGSPEVHEAEAAMRKAHALMLRYNVDVTAANEKQFYAVAQLGDPEKRSNRVEAAVVGLLAQLFFVKVIQVPVYLPRAGKRGSVYEIAGTPPNVSMASHVYAFLLATAERLWQTNRTDARVRSGRDRLAYQAGVIRGFHEKLLEERKTLSVEAAPDGGTALIWRGDRALDKFYHARHPRIASRRSRVRTNAAHSAGAEAGRTIVLHRPVSDGGSSRGRLLGSGS
ncbi:MAG TPA: DUF2786 domain-containing protein [Kofleriaceae bacterium]|nr:DUF2786 domain-containing protein [Kofleriaceae bacterium]